jgi:hypothetical protein
MSKGSGRRHVSYENKNITININKGYVPYFYKGVVDVLEQGQNQDKKGSLHDLS